MHVGRGQETIAMGNSHGQSKFLKNDLEKINRKLRPERQKLPNQFLPTLKAVSEHHAQQPSPLSILYFGFDLNYNVSNMQYIIHKM